MSFRHEIIYFLRCDVCGVEYHDAETRSAMETRVSAGQHGWKFKVIPRGQTKGKRDWDLCPQCHPEQIKDSE